MNKSEHISDDVGTPWRRVRGSEGYLYQIASSNYCSAWSPVGPLSTPLQFLAKNRMCSLISGQWASSSDDRYLSREAKKKSEKRRIRSIIFKYVSIMLSLYMARIQKHFTFRSRDLEFSKNLIFLWKIRNKYPVCEIYILRVV